MVGWFGADQNEVRFTFSKKRLTACHSDATIAAMRKEPQTNVDLDLLMEINAQHRESLQRLSKKIKEMESQLAKLKANRAEADHPIAPSG